MCHDGIHMRPEIFLLERVFRRAVLAVISLAAISAGVATAAAQFPMSEGKAAANSDRELEEHVASMRYLISQANKRKPGRHRDPKLALEQLQEDFTRVQIVNKELVLTTSEQKEVDFKFVARSAEEINKRAKRLLENLALPDPLREAPRNLGPITDQAELKNSITRMGWRIYYFAKNPIFKEANVIDTSDAAKARSDLDQIVELSALIKSGSERLGKKADMSNLSPQTISRNCLAIEGRNIEDAPTRIVTDVGSVFLFASRVDKLLNSPIGEHVKDKT